MKNNIKASDLFTQREALEVLKVDRIFLNRLVKENILHRIKCSADKRFSFYLRSEIEKYLNRKKEYYYE
jgi:hypothetical protein